MPSVATWLVPLLPNALTAHATQDMGADLETICTIEYSEEWPNELAAHMTQYKDADLDSLCCLGVNKEWPFVHGSIGQLHGTAPDEEHFPLRVVRRATREQAAGTAATQQLFYEGGIGRDMVEFESAVRTVEQVLRQDDLGQKATSFTAQDGSTDAGSSATGTPLPDQDMEFSSEEVASRYQCRSHLGSGVFGTVFLATDRRTNEDVAIKRMRPEEEMGGDGVPSLILREVALLRALDHPNIVKLKDILAVGLVDYYLIFEYVPEDLYRILRGLRKQGRLMPFASVVQFTQQMLNAIHWCHVLLIMHRDLKPQNILLHPTDGLKICDFGLARLFSAVPGSYTRDVVTLWYRSPELLLGSPQYSKEVDLWSGGCIVGEMSSGEPLFPGDSEIGTIFQIMQKRGSPTEASWPGHRATLQHWSDTFPRWQPTDLRCVSHRRPELGQEGMSLLHGLLTMNPASRLRARQAKEHTFLARQAQAALV